MTELWLSQIRLDIRNGSVRRDLGDPAAVHKRVMSLFPDVTDPTARAALGVLHRADERSDGILLLIQSRHEPDLGALPSGYGSATTTDLDRLLGTLGTGDLVHYRIVANASKRAATGPKAGKRIALGASDTHKWWAERATRAGLALISEPSLDGQLLGGRRAASRITVRPWRIDGLGQIVDVERLREAVATGIGPGKAYGCGMLSLARG